MMDQQQQRLYAVVIVISLVPCLCQVNTSSSDEANAVPARICHKLFGSKNQRFKRFALEGTTFCQCSSNDQAVCEPLRPYPTVVPGSPAAQLSEFHRPQMSQQALQALQSFQIQHQCRVFRHRGLTCEVNWPSSGTFRPYCDCQTKDGDVDIRLPVFLTSIEQRQTDEQ